MVKNKEIKIYLSKIKALLPVYSKSERLFVNSLKNNIYSFINTLTDPSMDDIIDQFGSPLEIVQGYIDSMEIDTLLNTISIRKTLRWIGVIVLLAAIAALAIFGLFYYKGYQYYKNTIITEYETIIDN